MLGCELGLTNATVELENVDKCTIARVPPGTSVTFHGPLLHFITACTGEGTRVSLVMEQYLLSDSDHNLLPSFIYEDANQREMFAANSSYVPPRLRG